MGKSHGVCTILQIAQILCLTGVFSRKLHYSKSKKSAKTSNRKTEPTNASISIPALPFFFSPSYLFSFVVFYHLSKSLWFPQFSSLFDFGFFGTSKTSKRLSSGSEPLVQASTWNRNFSSSDINFLPLKRRKKNNEKRKQNESPGNNTLVHGVFSQTKKDVFPQPLGCFKSSRNIKRFATFKQNVRMFFNENLLVFSVLCLDVLWFDLPFLWCFFRSVDVPAK